MLLNRDIYRASYNPIYSVKKIACLRRAEFAIFRCILDYMMVVVSEQPRSRFESFFAYFTLRSKKVREREDKSDASEMVGSHRI